MLDPKKFYIIAETIDDKNSLCITVIWYDAIL